MKVAAVPDELAEDLSTPAGAGSASSASLSAPPSTGQRPNATGRRDRRRAQRSHVAGAVSRRPCRPDAAAGAARHRRRREQRHVERHRPRPHRRATGDRVRRGRAPRRAASPIGRAIERGIEALPVAGRRRRRAGSGCCTTTRCRGPTPSPSCSRPGLRSKSVGVAGPKLVSWEDPRRLVEMGIQITRTGRRLGSPVRGEADQGQYDHRADVLAVSTSGMLVRRSVHDDIGGFDPAFVEHGADLDFGWRAQLAGHRVIVVPGRRRARRVRGPRRDADPASAGPARARTPRPPGRPSGHAGPVLAARRPLPRRLDGAVGRRRLR